RRSAEWKLFGFTLTHRSKVRRTPNPNVLLELGFAIAHLGWDRIVLVQNTEFGGPDELPFDLRGRRTVTYARPPDNTKDEKGERKRELSTKLYTAIGAALMPLDEQWRRPDRWEPRWWGFWYAGYEDGTNGGRLLIYELSASSPCLNRHF